MKIERSMYFNLKELKERKWTPSKINSLLQMPDLEFKNPIYASAAPMKLFFISRVKTIEETFEFQEWLSKSKSKREKISKIQIELNNKRREALFEYISNLNIIIPKLTPQKLYETAIQHYNTLWSIRGREEKIIHDYNSCEEYFLNRISLNMLRHNNSKYEHELDKMFGKVGNIEAYVMLKDKINTAILTKYPFLSNTSYD